MLYVIANKKDINKLKRKYKSTIDKNITFTEDEKVIYPIVFTKTETGSLVEWVRGIYAINSLLDKGYAAFGRRCPYRMFFGKCIETKCQLFLIENLLGDCSLRWSAVMDITAIKKKGV